MPAYSAWKTFVKAIKTGRTHITESLDDFFSDAGRVQLHAQWNNLRNGGSWSGGPPGWLQQVLQAPPNPNPWISGVGLTPAEAAHVLKWPPQELEKARDAVVRAVAPSGVVKGKAPKFFWEVYNGTTPRTVERVSSTGFTEIVFQSPRAAVVIQGDEVLVKDV